MWTPKQILNIVRQKGIGLLPTKKLPPVKRTRRARTDDKKDTKLEITYRRYGGRGSITKLRKGAWDAIEVSRRMERVLQPADGKAEAERIREKKARLSERSARIARLYQSEDFKPLWEVLKNWEVTDYINLTKPESRKEGISLEYYLGYINGQLGRTNDIKDFIIRAVITHKKHATDTE